MPLPPAFPDPRSELADQTSGWEWAGLALLLVLVAAPLVFRRRYPLSTLWVVLLTATMVAENPDGLRLSFYVCVIAAYSAAVYSPYRVLALLSLPVTAFLMGELQDDAAEPAFGGAINAVPQGVVPFLILAPIAVAAWGLRTLQARADAEQAHVVALQREGAEAVRRAAEEERARIARELHDVVTHNVSVMVIQAGAARQVMEASPQQAREALLSVEASGRAAMTELRHVMGLLTADGETLDLAPQPGMAELESLVGRVRASGLPVELVVTGSPDTPMPDGVVLAGYRVVQEALTNAVKHAAGSSATVRVDYGSARLSIEVTDTGGTRPPTADAGSGRGLVGLRERLALYGGTLEAGPRIRGGYRLARGHPPRARRRPRPSGGLVTDPVRVVVADDQALVRTGFRMILTADGIDVVAEAATGAEAIDAVRRTRPDVVLMDIRMPVLDGLEATRRIVAADADGPRILMLTTFDVDEYVYAALAAGASGFLLKDVAPEQLTAAVRLVRSGDALLAPSITRRLVERFARGGQETSAVHRDLASLTPREREVLQLLARGLSNAELAAAFQLSEATVKTHVARILGKLQLRDRVQAVVVAYETGLVAPGES